MIRSAKLHAAGALALFMVSCSPDAPKPKAAAPPGGGPVAVGAPADRHPGGAGHAKMVALLKEIAGQTDEENYWVGDREVRDLRRKLADLPPNAPLQVRWMAQAKLGVWEGWMGNFPAAIAQLDQAQGLLPSLQDRLPRELLYQFLLGAGMVWMRQGEVLNCCYRNTPESCILPIQGKGIHGTQGSSRRARATSSPVRVCSFSRASRASRAASHSSRVPTL